MDKQGLSRHIKIVMEQCHSDKYGVSFATNTANQTKLQAD